LVSRPINWKETRLPSRVARFVVSFRVSEDERSTLWGFEREFKIRGGTTEL